MREPLTVDVLEDKLADAETKGLDGHRELAAELLAFAEQPDDEDELSPADLLVGVGEQLSLAGEPVEALGYYQRAAECEMPTRPDARAFVVRALLDLDRTEEAEELSEQLRRSRPPIAETYLFMGEVWELAGELDRANRWLTRGALLAQSQGSRSEWSMLVLGRYRVRRALGFPPDDFDQAAASILAESRARYAQSMAEQAGGAGDRGKVPQAVVSQEGDRTVIDLF